MVFSKEPSFSFNISIASSLVSGVREEVSQSSTSIIESEQAIRNSFLLALNMVPGSLL